MRIQRFVMGLLFVAAACGPSAGNEAPLPNTRRDVLTHDDILSAPQVSSLYSAIQALRPFYLSAPMGVQPGAARKSIAIYLNGALQSGTESLQGIAADNVEEVRYLEPIKAQSEYGPIASGGALVIKLRKSSADP
ncbi:MAG: hypothetical protein ABI442_14420 [Gemmatimonadaceae bacterium]